MAAKPVILLLSAAALACGPAYADRIARSQKPVEIVEQVEEAPYSIEILDKQGRTLPTHAHGGRFYVEGSVGQRYTIRVTNPTDQRVEAVVSVDGLDVIDGETADFKTKRGYVVPARGELRIDGFRVSTAEVATFRFSSVDDSYAGRKGKPRNVGVIGLAVFEEKEQPQLILQNERPPRDYERRHYDYDYDLSEAPEAEAGGASAGEAAPHKPAPPPARTRSAGKTSADSAPTRSRRETCCTEKKGRPGLGTEFGERRTSRVQWTRFERRNPNKPDAFAELRYNDVDGLRAMGLDIDNPHDTGEVEIRETANPFPDSGFAKAP